MGQKHPLNEKQATQENTFANARVINQNASE